MTPPRTSRRVLRQRQLWFALLILVVLLSSALGYLVLISDLAAQNVYEVAIVALWACWLGLPVVATKYATWRFGPPRLVQPRLIQPHTSAAALARFQAGAAPSLN